MTESLAYPVFALCLICGGSVLVFLHWKHEWRHSYQRLQEEKKRFKWFMSKLEIEDDSVKEVTKQFRSTDDLVAANNRLKKCLNERS